MPEANLDRADAAFTARRSAILSHRSPRLGVVREQLDGGCSRRERGMFRLWAAASGLWGLLAGIFVVGCSMEPDCRDLGFWIGILIVPPILLGIVLLLGAWVLRGFRS